VGIPVRIPIPRQSWQTRTLRLGAKCYPHRFGLFVAFKRRKTATCVAPPCGGETYWTRCTTTKLSLSDDMKGIVKKLQRFLVIWTMLFPQTLMLKSAAKWQTDKQKTQYFFAQPGSVRSPSRIKLGWCVHMITLTNSLAERKCIGMVSVHLSVAVPSGIYSELLTRASVDTASVCFGPAVQEPIHLFLSVVQVSCNVYSYWDGQELASSTLSSNSSYWVGVKYTSVINLLFVIWRRVQQCRS